VNLRSLKSVRFVLVALLLILAAGCDRGRSNAAGAGETLRIGAVLPLTGDSAAWGQQGRWGIEFAVRKANEGGGIGGSARIEAIFEDSQALPRVAVNAFNKLSQVDRVQAVVGDIVSASTLAMAPLAEQRKVVVVAPTASAPAITSAGSFLFRVWPSDLLEGTAAADWARSQNIQKVCILHIQNDYGSGLAAAFRSRFEALGGTISSTQAYAQDRTDFRANLARIKAEAPDLVYLISYYKDAALALRQAKEMGLPTRFLGATAVESPDLLKLAGSSAEGLVYPTIVDFDPSNPSTSQRQFINEFKTMFGKEPDWASSHAHDAAVVIIEALRTGARTGDEIRRLIDMRRTFQGVTGSIKFDENGDVIDKPVVMKTVLQGTFAVLPSGR
jgi:branched-chain amino acid transport system substrate-binding protein